MNNPIHRKVKLAVTGSIITTMMLTSTAFAETLPGTGAGTGTSTTTSTTNTGGGGSNIKLSFPDVSASHWASKHILKLSTLGVVQGDETGYRPESEVSQQDVLIMAIRMMGLEEEALNSRSTSVFPWTDTRDDARAYVAMAIEKGLISMSEEAAFSVANWATRSATREWVAKIIVRAIGKRDLAATSTGASSFADAAKISANSLGYINAAVSLQLVYGFEDNTFKPAGSVTRAQMATFLSRAEKYLVKRSTRVYSGIVTKVEGSVWTVEKNGESKQIQMYPTASVFGKGEDGRRIAASDIKLYSEVYIVLDGNVGYYADILNDEVQMQTITGTLVSVNMNELTVTIEAEGMESTYGLASNVAIFDKNGGGVSLGSLLPDSVIELKKNAGIQNAKISQIFVKQVPVNKTVFGAYVALDTKTMTIKVKEAVTGLEETYPVTSATTVVMGDKPFDPAGLYAGDTVQLEIKNGKAVVVTVVKQLIELRDHGKILAIDTSKSFLTMQKAGSALASYTFSPSTQVVMEGNAYATVKDLNIGDDVKLEINGGVIARVIVTATSVKAFSMSTIISYDATEKTINLRDEAGKLAVYELTSKTKILYDQTEIPIESFANIFTKGKKVNLSVSDSDSKLLSIQIVSRQEGTVAQINAAAGELTIKGANNLTYTYKYISNPLVELASKSSSALADVRVGDSVRVVFNGTQDLITTIQVRESLIVHTQSKDSTNNTITVRESDTITATYPLNGIPIVREGQSSLTSANIPLDEWVEFNYIGKSLEAVHLLNPVRGIVTAIDTAAGKVTITDYALQTHVVEVGTQVTVKSEGNVYTSLSALKVNDRVQVATTSQAKTSFAILLGQTRAFSTYNITDKIITFKLRTLGDTNTYRLHEKAYVHQGNEVISPSFLLDNDLVQIYFFGDKIVEISR
ncbi:S-layer homology domain-containing protein [Paenibacillus koleovorans]|uniref:S-layer homology domain-containing protein n=1 Tax=Paenibacillus koleovorans TaxID=121608 RepID=UPI000FD8EF7E|nr:S-layer homology domain-containing protein [Paenibacillus koleovorans]